MRELPQAIDNRSSRGGLRTVAIFEALKGTLVLALACGLLSLLHRDVSEAAEHLLIHLHVSADHRFGHSILNAAARMNDARLWGFAIGAVAYTAVRYIEAWGLWNCRVWAEWFALLSGALYLPIEMVKLAERASLVHAAVLLGNVAILAYMLYIRLRAVRPWRRQ